MRPGRSVSSTLRDFLGVRTALGIYDAGVMAATDKTTGPRDVTEALHSVFAGDRALVVSSVVLAWLAALCGVAQPPLIAAQAWRDPSPHEIRWVTVDSSVRLEVLDWGGAGPPLVLLGCYLTAHAYDEFAPKLTDRFHVYGVTRRGIGASDRPPSGYSVQRSADDVLDVLRVLRLQNVLLVGASCAGQVLTMLASQHSDRLTGLVYFDGAGDPTLTAADVGLTLPDPKALPRPIAPPPDASSFGAFRASQGRILKVTFPEAEWRQQFEANPDGSVGRLKMSLDVRRAITVDARIKPDYSSIRVPVLAIYQAEGPFEEAAAHFDIRSEEERNALLQERAVDRALSKRAQQDLRAAIPSAHIIELTGANLFMFLSNEADVLREIGAFAQTLNRR